MAYYTTSTTKRKDRRKEGGGSSLFGTVEVQPHIIHSGRDLSSPFQQHRYFAFDTEKGCKKGIILVIDVRHQEGCLLMSDM